MQCSGSPISNSISLLCAKYSLQRENLHVFGGLHVLNHANVNDNDNNNNNDLLIANTISELLDCRDGIQFINNFVPSEIDEVIKILCEH